jgi:hypothetical protein
MSTFQTFRVIGVGLLFLHASVWQMLRGSNIIFSAIIQACTLKRKNEPDMWAGVGIVALSLIVVGLAAVFANGFSSTDVSTWLTIASIVLTIAGQFLRGVILEDISISPYLVVGLEGFWGCSGQCASSCRSCSSSRVRMREMEYMRTR